MPIRTFGEKGAECWICGWFDMKGRVVDIQQYATEYEAREAAEDIMRNNEHYGGNDWSEASYFPFVGKIEMLL